MVSGWTIIPVREAGETGGAVEGPPLHPESISNIHSKTIVKIKNFFLVNIW